MKVKKKCLIKQFKTLVISSFVGYSSTYSAYILANCPVVLSSDTSMPIDDMGEASCSIIINTGVTLSTIASDGVTIRGNNSNIINSGTISSIDSLSINIRPSAVATINNSGTISATNLSAISNQGTISILSNGGAITSTGGYGVVNDSSSMISTFNNSQGGNSSGLSTTPLTYFGKLPANYNIVVNSPTHYGQLAVTSPLGATTFGIYSGGVFGLAASSLTEGTYSSVLMGLTASNLTGATSGTYGLYSWSLINANGTNWNLVVTSGSGSGGSGNSSNDSNTTETFSVTGIVNVASIPAGATVVLNGGILTGSGTISQPIVINRTTYIAAGAKINITGTVTGSGRLDISSGSSVTMNASVNLPGGLDISSGAVVTSNGSITGPITVSSGAVLKGSGVFPSNINVLNGRFAPGNSPGYMNLQSNLILDGASIYQQNIAGATQASASTPIGLTGYYSFVKVDGQAIIGSESTLQPVLRDLFSADQTSYGSAPYVPKLGDQFRMLTASGGITGRFSTLIQPDGMGEGTQLVSFYNMNNSNSIDLAVIPTSYPTTIASASGNKNAQSIGAALDRIARANHFGTSTTAQDTLLFGISGQTSASNIASYAQSLAGEVYAAAVAVIAQTTQRVQQAVMTRLGDTMGITLPNSTSNPAGNTGLMATTNTALSGGVTSSGVSSNPNVNPNTDTKTFSNGNVWGDLVYQKGNRSSDGYSGGWNSNLYQLVFGSDFYAANGARIGGGLSLSSTSLNPTYGSGTIQQGSIFAYGKMPIQEFVVDGMVSFGLNSSDLSRGDVTGLSNGFKSKSISGNDALVSLGLSRTIDTESVRITPYARLTWQFVTQSAVNEGNTAAALSVNSFTGNGVRGVIGAAIGSKTNNPMRKKYTYRAYVGVGADSSGLLNPTLNASIAGMATNITTPNAGSTFVQAGLYGTAKVSENTYAYAGLSGEARSGQTLGAVNAGLRIQF